MKTNKPQYKTESVTRDDGTVCQVTRAAMKDVPAFLELQDKLLGRYVEVDGAFAKIMIDPDAIADLTAICSLLPLVEKTKSGETQYLSFEDIQDNWEQLIVLFFNGDLNPEKREAESISPSRIGQLHFFPYLEVLKKYLDEKREKDAD